jgi:hypothetical protein
MIDINCLIQFFERMHVTLVYKFDISLISLIFLIESILLNLIINQDLNVQFRILIGIESIIID